MLWSELAGPVAHPFDKSSQACSRQADDTTEVRLQIEKGWKLKLGAAPFAGRSRGRAWPILFQAEASLSTDYLVAWAANKWAARLKETQAPAHFTCDTDAHSCPNVRSLSNRSPKPKRPVGTQVNSVQTPVDLQRSRKASRSSRQIYEFFSFAEPFHLVDSFKGLNGAQQHSCANLRVFSRHVEHVGRPIDEVHISKSLAQE